MNRSGYLIQFQKGTSRDASKHGRNAGTAVLVQKGSTLKVMEEFNIKGKQISFYKYCPGTFGYIFVLLLLSVQLLFLFPIIKHTSWDSIAHIVPGLQCGERRKSGLISDRVHKFFFSPEPADLPRGLWNGYRKHIPWRISGRGVKFTTDNHSVFSLRKNGAKSSLPHTSSWNEQGQF